MKTVRLVAPTPTPTPTPTLMLRRQFVRTSLAAIGGFASGCAIHVPGRKRYDVVLRGGTLFDGTGRAGHDADVAIFGHRIAAIRADLADSGRLELDVRGLAVAPGFVDIHSHADGTLLDDPRAESVVRQGITTVIVGQDGTSRAPRLERNEEGARGRTVHDLLDEYDDLRPAVNIATMVGLGTVRAEVVGDDDRLATDRELAQMVRLVDRALADGACGASSGLEYTPGAFASRGELIALCRPLARRALPYATHLRNEDDQLLEAIDEAIAVARGAGAPLQISHLKTQGPRNWEKIDAALARIETARNEGLDIAFDRYPYVAYQTGLSNLFPPWSRDGGTEAFLLRLTDSANDERLRSAVREKIESIGGWDNVMISSVADRADAAAEGQRLGQYAGARGRQPYDIAVELLLRSRDEVGMVGFAMSERNAERFLAHPLGMVCSDGGAFAIDGPTRRGHPHPRSLGAFPRVLGHYVRETGVLTLHDAIRKMAAFPASRVRLARRGRLEPRYAADVVVFDPATVRDRATFTEPFQYPTGIEYVLVNGGIAIARGDRGGRRFGRALRPR